MDQIQEEDFSFQASHLQLVLLLAYIMINLLLQFLFSEGKTTPQVVAGSLTDNTAQTILEHYGTLISQVLEHFNELSGFTIGDFFDLGFKILVLLQ